MLAYHFKTALTSLKRNPVLTVLLISGIALGICVSTAFVTLRHLFTQDPLPGKTDKVFYVQLDSWSPDRPYNSEDPTQLPDQVTYRDARALLQSKIPPRQTAAFVTRMFVHPDPKKSRPFQADIRLAFSDFFDIFDVPFEYGGPWTKAADAKPEAVAVIDSDTNQKLFGGENSVGKTLRLEERDYRIVGVLKPYRPAMRWWELNRDPTGKPEPIYIPFNFVEPLTIWTRGNTSGWKSRGGTTHQHFINSETVWIQYWVELPDDRTKAAYGDWLTNYIRDQKKVGRFLRPTATWGLATIPQIIERSKFVPTAIRAMSIVSLLFLTVCSVNLIGILLGKFLARVPEVSVRRALGASRADIFWQHFVEVEIIGLAGGAIGIIASAGLIEVLAKFMPNGEALHLDGEMLLLATILSVVAGAVAGVYPAWRVCSVPPAMQLKVQ